MLDVTSGCSVCRLYLLWRKGDDMSGALDKERVSTMQIVEMQYVMKGRDWIKRTSIRRK